MRGCRLGLSEEGVGSLLCLFFFVIFIVVVGVLGLYIFMEVGVLWEF